MPKTIRDIIWEEAELHTKCVEKNNFTKYDKLLLEKVYSKQEVQDKEKEIQELKDTIKRLENLLFKFQNNTFVDISEVKKLQKENEKLKSKLKYYMEAIIKR